MTSKRKYGFRCQYQKGNECISVCINSEKAIGCEEIMVALAELAVKVQYYKNDKTGGEVALQVLMIHGRIMKDFFQRHINEFKKSYYLNRKSKRKEYRTERVDIEFYGDFGGENKKHILNNYIHKYRKAKGWNNE